jgi:hypothetical protein
VKCRDTPANDGNKLSILYCPTLVSAFVDKQLHEKGSLPPECEETLSEAAAGGARATLEVMNEEGDDDRKNRDEPATVKS